MVVVEGTPREAEAIGEVVQLIEGDVADQVGEAAAVGRPDRPVDEDHTDPDEPGTISEPAT